MKSLPSYLITTLPTMAALCMCRLSAAVKPGWALVQKLCRITPSSPSCMPKELLQVGVLQGACVI